MQNHAVSPGLGFTSLNVCGGVSGHATCPVTTVQDCCPHTLKYQSNGVPASIWTNLLPVYSLPGQRA